MRAKWQPNAFPIFYFLCLFAMGAEERRPFSLPAILITVITDCIYSVDFNVRKLSRTFREQTTKSNYFLTKHSNICCALLFSCSTDWGKFSNGKHVWRFDCNTFGGLKWFALTLIFIYHDVDRKNRLDAALVKKSEYFSKVHMSCRRERELMPKYWKKLFFSLHKPVVGVKIATSDPGSTKTKFRRRNLPRFNRVLFNDRTQLTISMFLHFDIYKCVPTGTNLYPK